MNRKYNAGDHVIIISMINNVLMPMDYFTKEEKVAPKPSTIAFLKKFARNYRAVEVENDEYLELLLS